MSRAALAAVALTALISSAPLSAIDPDRDFSGRWILDPAASSVPADISVNAENRLAVEQLETSLSCSAGYAGGNSAKWSFTADGNESKYQIGAERRNAVAKWEGSALLVNTIVSGPADYTVADRWVLSRDRSTLRVERRVVRRNGESEGLFVYRREGTMLTDARPLAAPAPEPRTLSQRPAAPAISEFIIEPGTRIPLALMNSLSAKRARDGDRVYLETVFPVSAAGRVVIPRGSYVAGTVTQAKSSGRVSGKSEMYIRFDTLTLPNGVTRDFRGRVSGSDAKSGTVDRQEGKITAESDKGADARKVAEGTAMGASIGSIAGAISHHPGFGLGVGAAAGAAAGLASVLTSRGSDVTLPKGTTLEMVLDRELRFQPEELRF